MAVTTAAPHFIQTGQDPVFVGTGGDILACTCGQVLIAGYDPDRFLAIALQCGACGTVTETPGLAPGQAPPAPLVVAEEGANDAEFLSVQVTSGATLVGRTEMDRITGLYRPRTPASNIYAFDDALLDDTAARFAAITGAKLPDVVPDFEAGLAQHPLAWSIGYLRTRLRDEAWACMEAPPSSVACLTVAGFRHFVATWSDHPLFPAMAATAADRGFAVHGLALFAAAHCLLMQNNRIGFPNPSGPPPGRLDYVRLATGPAQSIRVMLNVFDRFEVPSGRPWTPELLRIAVQEAIEAEQGRINPRHPGLLLLSPGLAMSDFDEALIRAIQAVVQSVGRRHRGLMAVAPIVLRLARGPDRRSVQFGYGLFPVENRHYRNTTIG